MNDEHPPKIGKRVKDLTESAKAIGKSTAKSIETVKTVVQTGLSTSKAAVQKANEMRKSVLKRETISKGVSATSKGAKILARGAELASKGAKKISSTMEKTSEGLKNLSNKLKE